MRAAPSVTHDRIIRVEQNTSTKYPRSHTMDPRWGGALRSLSTSDVNARPRSSGYGEHNHVAYPRAKAPPRGRKGRPTNEAGPARGHHSRSHSNYFIDADKSELVRSRDSGSTEDDDLRGTVDTWGGEVRDFVGRPPSAYRIDDGFNDALDGGDSCDDDLSREEFEDGESCDDDSDARSACGSVRCADTASSSSTRSPLEKRATTCQYHRQKQLGARQQPQAPHQASHHPRASAIHGSGSDRRHPSAPVRRRTGGGRDGSCVVESCVDESYVDGSSVNSRSRSSTAYRQSFVARQRPSSRGSLLSAASKATSEAVFEASGGGRQRSFSVTDARSHAGATTRGSGDEHDRDAARDRATAAAGCGYDDDDGSGAGAGAGAGAAGDMPAGMPVSAGAAPGNERLLAPALRALLVLHGLHTPDVVRCLPRFANTRSAMQLTTMQPTTHITCTFCPPSAYALTSCPIR